MYIAIQLKFSHSIIWRIPYQNAPKGISETLIRFYGLRFEKGFMFVSQYQNN